MGCIFWILLSILFVSLCLIAWYDWIFHFKSMWFCDKMGWHYVNETNLDYFDGASIHSVCVRCGKEVMRDSQGNWF